MPNPDHGKVGAPRKLGVTADDFAVLAGATDFIVSCIDGLLQAADGREVVLILRAPASIWSPFGLARRLRNWLRGNFRSAEPDWQGQLIRLRGAGLPDLPVLVTERSEWALAKLCRNNGIDVIGPLTNAPRLRFPLPWVGYLFDFQHRHLPQLFAPKVIEDRDRMFGNMLAKADAVVVNARDVQNDAQACFPGLSDRIFALPFSAAPKVEWFGADVDAARQQYGIAKRYFLISNQFWIHKRHEIAIEAFARIALRHDDIELVLTGETSDWRQPNRRENIEALAMKLGMDKRIHILGLIPKLDQIALMRGALAVVQPTAFEGGPGGGSVFDATALGVPTIVSDIPVNREIEQFVTWYFALDDIDALADAMEQSLTLPREAIDTNALIAAGAARRKAMGQRFWEAAEHAVNHARMVRNVQP